MSNTDTDSFIREVTEEVRQDRLIGYWKKYGPFVLGAILAAVLAAAALAWLEERERQAAHATGGVLIQASQAEEGGLSPETVEGLVAEVEGSARVIADMQIARALAADGRTEDAVARLTTLAGDATLPRRYTDLATLEAARLQASAGQLDVALPALDELVLGDSAYRVLALELRAALRLNIGDMDGARGDLLSVLTDPATTPETRARAQALQATLPPEALSATAPDDAATPPPPGDAPAPAPE